MVLWTGEMSVKSMDGGVGHADSVLQISTEERADCSLLWSSESHAVACVLYGCRQGLTTVEAVELLRVGAWRDIWNFANANAFVMLAQQVHWYDGSGWNGDVYISVNHKMTTARRICLPFWNATEESFPSNSDTSASQA